MWDFICRGFYNYYKFGQAKHIVALLEERRVAHIKGDIDEIKRVDGILRHKDQELIRAVQAELRKRH